MEKSLENTKIYETIAEMIDDHILVCDIEGQIVFSNRAMQSYLGYTDLELKGKGFLEIIADIHRNKAESFWESASENPSEWEEFLFQGRHEVRKLHLKFFHKSDLIYIYGNEKYVECERIQKKLAVEIDNAIKIHKRSLPISLPATEKLSFASFYLPAEELGGDLFDAFQVDNGLLNDFFEQYVCFIADVSGHGLDSAMLAVYMKDTIRSFFRLKHIAGQVLSPKEIMHFFIEQYMKEGYPGEYLVCLFLVVFDFKTKELSYCNAGFHISPILIKDEENIIELSNAGMPITTAIKADLLKYEDTVLPLLPNMTLFMMSDGLPEQRSEDIFYEDRLKKLLPEIYCLDPVEIVEKIQEDFNDFVRYEKIKDDITLLVGKLLPSLSQSDQS